MGNEIRICLLGSFRITSDAQNMDAYAGKSRKGMALLQYLILARGRSVPLSALIDALWPGDHSSNPESALKTLISRLRVILAQISPELGECIATERGSYRWEQRAGVHVDLFEFERLVKQLDKCSALTDKTDAGFRRLLSLYGGDLLRESTEDWVVSRRAELHGDYLRATYHYLSLLCAAERYDDIISVCRTALDVDAFDETLHLQLMNALVKTCRNNEALLQYKHVTSLHSRYLGVQPPEGIQEFYKQIVHAGEMLEVNLESICDDLREYDKSSGAFVCEYTVFKEIYNLQIRNLERLHSNMFIALLMLSDVDASDPNPLQLNDVMSCLLKVLVANLRKGDTVTQFSPTQFAVLLPMMNYDTGRMVMDRLKSQFYQLYPNSCFMLTYRLAPLNESGKQGTGKDQ